MQKGYSLIELLVVLGIMGLLAAYGIASYNTINDWSRVEQSAASLVTTLRDWQKQADAGSDSEVCSDDYVGRNVRMINNKQLVSSIMCGSVESAPILEHQLLNNTELVNFNTFLFLPLGGGISPARQFEVRNEQGNSYRIFVDSGGGISAQRLP